MNSKNTAVARNLNGRVAAGIVVFEPHVATFRRLLDNVGPGVDCVLLFINRLTDDDLRQELDRNGKVTLIQSPVNVGVGEALNALIAHAESLECGLVALFDQDSRPAADMLQRLATSFREFSKRGENAAVIGPALVAPRGRFYKEPRYFTNNKRAPCGASRPVQFLPTSGSLISIEAFREIGPFRGDYFIDGIDLEWCFRAWASGYSCWLATDVTMEHTVGEGALRVKSLGFQTPRQKDFRVETYVRNTVYGFRLPHIPLSWKLRQGPYLLLQLGVMLAARRFDPALAKRIVRGFVNGIRGKLGPPEGVPFT